MNFYDMENINQLLEEDELSAEEACFMAGYLEDEPSIEEVDFIIEELEE